MIIIIIIMLFNNLKQHAIILLTVPFAIIGVAVIVMGGLTFATGLTLILVPVLYVIFYHVKWQKS